MDRNKLPSMGRGAKNKINQFPQDIFALGSKTSVAVNRDVEGKRNIHKSSTSDRKREPSSSGVQATKKPKLTVTSSSPGDGSGPSASLEVEPVDLVSSVLSAVDTHNSDKLLGLLTGAIRLLKAQRWKPDLILCHSLLYLAKIRPNMFSNENVTQSLCGLLKREQGTAFKSKGNPLVFVLACNILYAGHRESKNWPDLFIKVYIEDALNERWWVDCAWCKCLVENITTAFNTSTPPAHLIPSENNALGTMSPSGSPLLGSGEEEGDNTDLDYTVFPRYSSSYETVEAMVLEAIKEQLSRRAAPDGIGKGFLKLLSATCGFPEIRMISAHRLEAWLHSGKLWRAAQELLAHVCCNAETSGPAAQRDHEVLAQLARMRLKTKPLVAAYVVCLREMVLENQVTLRSVVTHTIYNELSNVRNPNNMAVLGALVQAQPQSVPLAMAETYQELLMRPEEFLRPLRALTREAARAGRADAVLALVPLCRGLAAPPPHDPPNEVRERAFSSIADLFCQCCMLSASHSKHLPDYRQQIAAIQSDGVSWLLETAMPIYRPAHQEYVHALHKIMFLDNVETYCKLDNWPPDSERTLTFRMSCEVPLLQNTLVRIVLIGLSKELPLTPGEAFELVEQLVRRACALAPEDNPLPIDKIELAEYIFQLCQYHHPENITLPAGYTAPSLAITSLYWRAWLVLVMLAAHNPHTFARDAFHKYPTLKALIEMCITNKFTVEYGSAEVESERAAVLQLEAHLAAASNAKLPITEHTSRLLSQLMIMEPTGVARRPPPAVVECLQSLCSGLRLGRLLCRQPALLLDIVQRHGTRRAMPWLHDLLHNSQHSLSVLPVQCLCEFLVVGGAGAESGKALELARHLQRMLAEEEGARAVLGYFLQRLAHVHAAVRTQANRGLKLVLTPIGADEPSEAEWNANVAPEVDTRQWLSLIASTPHWEALRETTAAAVRAACLADAEPRRLAAYLAFLTHHADTCLTADHMQDLVLDLSQLIVERMTIMAAILPSTEYSENKEEVQVEEDILGPHHTLYALNSIFHNYMQKVRMPRADSDAYEWCASQERVLLQWPAGEQCTVHILVVHAAVILLCYGPSLVDQDSALYEWWMGLWFSPEPPKAYLVDTSEEALLLPDWLRLRMVRSARPRLVQAGLRGLDAQQLALFIQSFGIPVPSMSALLSALDDCPAEAVRRLAVERGYMAQLVAVQRARGAVAGERFSNTLNLQEPEYPEDDLFSKPPAKNTDSNEDPWAELPETESLPLEQVGPLFATAFAAAHTFTGDVDAAFTTLQSVLFEETKLIKRPSFETADCPYIQCIVIYLGMVLSSINYVPFASGFLGCSMYSVPLVRLLLTCRRSPFEQSLVKVADTLLLRYSAASGPLIVALKEMSMLGSDGGAGSGGDVEVLKSKREGEMKIGTVAKDEASKEELVRVLESCSANTLEQVGNDIINTQNTKVVIEAISLILEKNQTGAYEQDMLLLKVVKLEDGEEPVNQEHVFSEKGLGCGLLIDWMSELQPEILGDDPSLQMRLMFKDGGAAWRPLLATLLAHRASWRTLNTCVTTLLKPDSGWRASSVLELVSALTQSPRVWQGRDKTTPKHHTPEDILHLNHQQLASLVTYILEEASTPSFDADHACQSIEARLPLLLECCSRDDSALLAAMSGAEHQLANGNEAAKIFLLLFYMRVPKILQLLVDSSSDYRGVDVSAMLPTDMDPVADCSVSVVDKVSHCLLTALAATQSNSKDSTKKAAAMESACRSLSSRHWRLAVRQLPLLAALLGGLTARLPSVIALHAHLLATLEAIPSHALFASKHRKHVHQILDCYLQLAVRQGHAKEVSSLLHRTAALLRKYASAAPLEAHAYLQRHMDIVTSQPALSALLSGREGSSSSDLTSAGVVTTAPPSALPPPHALQLLQQRPPSMAPSDDLHWALQEVEAWGKRRGGAWGGSSSAGALLAATAPLSSHTAPAVRNSALALLAKLLPAVQDTAPGFSAIMQCLDAPQPDVALSALERLPELVVGLQEHATQILLKVFDLGMRSKINTETYISKCVTVLNLHRGC